MEALSSMMYRKPTLFITSQFYSGRWCVWIRCAWATLLTFLLLGCALSSGYVEKVAIFLTYWSFTILTLYHWTALVNTVRYPSITDSDITLPYDDPYLKLQWVLFNIGSGAAIIVSLLFWTTEYSGTGLTFCNLTLHLFNTAMVFLNIATTTTPVEFRGWKFVSLYGIIYGVFTVIYWLCGGTNHKGEPYIYGMLDYSQHPARSILMLLGTCFIAAPLSQVILVWFHRLTRCKRSTVLPV